MPLIPSLAVSGSPCRSLAHTSHIFRLPISTPIAVWRVTNWSSSWPIRSHVCPFAALAPIRRHGTLASGDTHFRIHEHGAHRVNCARSYSNKDDQPIEELDRLLLSDLGVDLGSSDHTNAIKEEGHMTTIQYQSRPKLSSQNMMKARRQSQPALILESMQNSARALYTDTPDGTNDLSYISPRRRRIRGIPRRLSRSTEPNMHSANQRLPVSLHKILARYIEIITASPWAEADYQMTQQDLALLEAKGYTQESIKDWASCLLNRRSVPAAAIFQPGNLMPPLFLVLLFLRRKRMRTFAFGIVLKHIELRLQLKHISWEALKILVVRLLRHARKIWPESKPMIASVFTSETSKLLDNADHNGELSAKFLSDVTHFSNMVLSLLSLPSSLHPVLSSLGQEKAQFQVLQFMANRTPALIVTRTGFRAVVRNQLAHKKTSTEREWARLKGEGWPPWKESRNAMDEEKGYEFGTSRASNILHRMYEAGYGARRWEEVAELYAGWDTDLSPTIQTRTSLPYMSTQFRNPTRLETLLWAGRVRTTRTRREAWACFLAYEASGTPARQEVYRAMFEKLHYSEMRKSEPNSSRTDTMLLPGDVKEVVQEPQSPLHLVYLSEPVPSFEQLYYRMAEKGLRPTNRLLAFLLQASTEYSMGLRVLESAKDDFEGGIQHLLCGTIGSADDRLPGSIVAAFTHLLCTFGHFSRLISTVPTVLSPDEHIERLKTDQHYMLEYAHALLLNFRPHYRPAWTTFMKKIVYGCTKVEAHRMDHISVQYKIICELVDKMEQEDLELDDEQFRLVCMSTSRAAQHALQGDMSRDDAHAIFTTGASRLRKIFHTLVNANLDNQSPSSPASSNPVPPHIPAPGPLHYYVRALGILREFEALYSFATWAASHHVELTARANAQHSGPRLLFNVIIAMRAGLEGHLAKGREGATKDLMELVKAQIESVEGWEWPSEEDVERYNQGKTGFG